MTIFRETYFPQITQIYKELENKPDFDKLSYLLGKISQCAITAARCVTSEEQTPIYIYVYLFSLLYFKYLHIIMTL